MSYTAYGGKRYRGLGKGWKGKSRYRGRKAWTPGASRTSGYYGRYNTKPTELKFHDVDLDDAVVATGGTIVPTINIIPQGTTEIQRIGRKCTITQIGWKYNYTLPNTDVQTGTADVFRMIMYQDKQCNGATATVTGILESADYQSFNNLVNSGRFRTLCDKTFVISSSAGAYDGTNDEFGVVERHGTFYKKCNIPLEFDDTTGALTEIRSNNLGVLLISKTGLVGFVSKIRLRFQG